ncbi:MAG: radical SAM protein [Candidatus Altiarchaeota archaeon]
MGSDNRNRIYTTSINPGCYSATGKCSLYLELFERNGYEKTDDYREASVIFIYTCISHSKAEEIFRNRMDEIMRNKREDAEVILSGCEVFAHSELIRNTYGCFVFGFNEEDKLEEHLRLKRIREDELHYYGDTELTHVRIRRWKVYQRICSSISRVFKYLYPPVNKALDNFLKTIRPYSPGAYYVIVGDGCTNNCSYCSIKLAKGYVKSRDLDAILGEIRLALENGYNHFTVISDDFASYGKDVRDKDIDCIDLLNSIFSIGGGFTIDIPNLNPIGLEDKLEEFVEAIVPGRVVSVHLPLQSGSDRILKLMARDYTRDEYINMAGRILERDPEISIRTDIIVGFPSETEEDFQQTLDIIDKIPFGRVEPFIYDDRPGKPASDIQPKVPLDVMKKRKQRISVRFIKNLIKNAL